MIKRIYKVSKTVTHRSTQAVFNKLIEEVGELSVEINSKYHESYKKGGVDGIKGETVDILINCFDILYLEGVKKKEIMKILKSKLSKWKEKANESK